MPKQDAIIDNNQTSALLAHSGTAGTADTIRVVASSTGALTVNQGNKISGTAFNSRDAATLAAGGTFQGVGEDVAAYGRLGVAVKSDNATNGTLTMEVSHDGTTNWGGPTRTWVDTRFSAPHMWNIVEKYFRLKYVNGGTIGTNLAIQVQYSNNADVILGHQLDENLNDETESIITRSVIAGRTTAGGGEFVNVKVSPSGAVQVGGDLAITAGTQNTLGTVGTITGVGIVTRIGNIGTIESGTVTTSLALNSGTITTIQAGTQQTLGTVGTVNGIGTISNIVTTSGTVTGVGVVTSVTNLVAGTLLNSGTTTGVGVVTSVTNLVSGTLLNSGTATGVGVVSVLTLGTVRQSFGSFTFRSSSGTTTLSSTAGIVHSVVIGSLLGGGTLYNSAGTSTAIIWSAITPLPNTYSFDVTYGSLTWAGTGTSSLTIVYS